MTKKNTKLLTVLSTLDDREWKTFKKYLLIHTGHDSDNMNLIDYLYKKRKSIESLTVQDVHAYNFSDMSSKAVLNMFSRVFLWLEEWIAVEEMTKEKYATETYRLKAYNRKGLYHLADKLSDQIEKKIEGKEKLDIKDSETLKKIAYLQYYSNNPIKAKHDVKLLNQIVNNQLKNFKEQSLIYLIELHNANNKLPGEFDDLINKIKPPLTHVKGSKLSDIIESAKSITTNEDITNLVKLISDITLIEKNTELHNLLFSYLNKACKRMWVADKISDKKIYEQIANYGMESGEYIINGRMNTLTFHNIVSELVFYSDYSKTSLFINKWINNVHTKDSHSVRKIADAINSFYSEKYNEVLDLLSLVQYETTEQKTRGLCMQAIAYYMIEDYDHLHDHLINLKRLISRNKEKMRGRYYQSQLNLIKVIEQLIKQKYNSKITIDLSEFNPLFYKSWCLKQV